MSEHQKVNENSKSEQLEQFRSKDEGHILTTNQGLKVSKPIAVTTENAKLLETAEHRSGLGVIIGDGGEVFAASLVAAISAHRFWERME
ncbi:MAG TPA: hypothetical protein VGN87_03030 [Paenibacillus sp.]|jgi:hypothetical protein